MSKIEQKPSFAVCYACDDNYEMFAAISMLSLFENNPDTGSYIVMVLGDNLSKKTQCHFKELAAEHHCEILICNVHERLEWMKNNGCTSKVANSSMAAYSRLFFQEFIPPDVKRVLYIDCDTIVNSDISDLHSFDMKDNVIAALWDVIPVKYNEILGVSKRNHYFNSGVMLIDCKKWINGKYQLKITTHLVEHFGKYMYCDQDVLNIVLDGKAAPLPPEYNFFPHFQQFTPAQTRYLMDADEDWYYTDAQFEKAKNCPRIIHYGYAFTGRPWVKGNLNELTYKWDEYLSKSIYRDYIKKKEPLDKRIIVRVLYKICPRGIFVRFYKMKNFRWMKADMYDKK